MLLLQICRGMLDHKHPLGPQAATLNRLARALGVPAEEFLGESSDSDANDLLALVQLWSEIEDNQGRRRVMSVARQEAERGSYKGSA